MATLMHARIDARATQVPTAPVFHTSASSHTIRIGSVTVRMVNTSNGRPLEFSGEPTGAALSPLWCLGKDNVTLETVATIEAASDPRRSINLALPTYRTGWRKRWPMSHGKPPTPAGLVCMQVQIFRDRLGI